MERADLGAALLDHLLLGLEALAAHAVHRVVVSLVDVALGGHALPHGLDRRPVVGIGSPDEAVVAEPGLPPYLLELGYHAIAIVLRGLVVLARDTLDFLPMLVGTGQKEGLMATGAMVTRERVRNRRGVEGPEVRKGVDVVDGRRDVEKVRHGGPRLTQPLGLLVISTTVSTFLALIRGSGGARPARLLCLCASRFPFSR